MTWLSHTLETPDRMNHTEYPKSLKDKTDAELWGIIRDASEAAEIGKGWNPKVGYYLDEVNYCLDEIRYRRTH